MQSSFTIGLTSISFPFTTGVAGFFSLISSEDVISNLPLAEYLHLGQPAFFIFCIRTAPHFGQNSILENLLIRNKFNFLICHFMFWVFLFIKVPNLYRKILFHFQVLNFHKISVFPIQHKVRA